MRTALWLACSIMIGLTVACEGSDARAALEAPRGPAEAPSLAAESREGKSDPDARAPEYEIYHDLTQFAWYKQGQPLMAGDQAYQPHGPPIAASADRLARAGSYGGVSYYVDARTEAENPNIVYVPVFERYWQPFVRTGATRPAPAPPADGG